MPEELHHYEVTDGYWRIVAEYIGEGYSGDYDEEDPDDAPLMRYDFFRKGEEEAVDSYCTLMPTTNPDAVRGMAHLFLDALAGKREWQKRRIEELTWTEPEVAAYKGKEVTCNQTGS